MCLWDKKVFKISLVFVLAFAANCVQCFPGFNDDYLTVPKSFTAAH